MFFFAFFCYLLNSNILSAQNYYHVPSLNSSGKKVTGQKLYEPASQSNVYNIVLMKYEIDENSDVIYGVLISGRVVLRGYQSNNYLKYNSFIDYKEITPMLQWIEESKKLILANQDVTYMSYSPKNSNSTLYIKKNKSSFSLNIQYTNSTIFARRELCSIGYSSKNGYNFSCLDRFYNQLSEIKDVVLKELE